VTLDALADDAFLREFETCSIALESWSVRCHVRMADL
jgi:hypothetical protein